MGGEVTYKAVGKNPPDSQMALTHGFASSLPPGDFVLHGQKRKRRLSPQTGTALLPGPGASLSLVHAVLPVIYQRLRCHPCRESREKGLSSTCSLRVTLQGEAVTPKPQASRTWSGSFRYCGEAGGRCLGLGIVRRGNPSMRGTLRHSGKDIKAFCFFARAA